MIIMLDSLNGRKLVFVDSIHKEPWTRSFIYNFLYFKVEKGSFYLLDHVFEFFFQSSICLEDLYVMMYLDTNIFFSFIYFSWFNISFLLILFLFLFLLMIKRHMTVVTWHITWCEVIGLEWTRWIMLRNISIAYLPHSIHILYS